MTNAVAAGSFFTLIFLSFWDIKPEGKVMDLISLVVVLIVIGVLLWLVNSYIPMEWRIKQILNGLVVVCVVLWILNATGILGTLPAPLVSLVGALIVVGLVMWLTNFSPMDARIKQALNVVVIIMVVLWLLRAIGVFHFGSAGLSS